MIINEDLHKSLYKGKPYWKEDTRLGTVEVHSEYDPNRPNLYFIALETPDSGKVFYYQELSLSDALKIGNRIATQLEKLESNKDTYGDAPIIAIAKEYDMSPFYY